MDNFYMPKLNVPKVEPIVIDTPFQHMFVDEQFQIIKNYIQEFEKTLDVDHEVGVMMTNFGQSIVMQVTEITYEEPVLLIFRGYINGKMSVLIQHMNQLNFLLTSLDKVTEEPKRKIGFIIPD
ncbi:MAG: hypothetical protein IKY23_03145 [Lachnospiraceae bacterium]|nr:hypothetical protein [Lachnospiraceae bacterium]